MRSSVDPERPEPTMKKGAVDANSSARSRAWVTVPVKFIFRRCGLSYPPLLCRHTFKSNAPCALLHPACILLGSGPTQERGGAKIVLGLPTPAFYGNLEKEAPQKRHGALVAHIPRTLLFCCRGIRGRFGAYPSVWPAWSPHWPPLTPCATTGVCAAPESRRDRREAPHFARMDPQLRVVRNGSQYWCRTQFPRIRTWSTCINRIRGRLGR